MRDEERRAKNRTYMRAWRLRTGRHKPRDPTPPIKPDKTIRQADPHRYKILYNRWWRHNGYTARIWKT